MRGNCLIYALRKWWREGGYLVIRRSHASRFIPHVLHLDADMCAHKRCMSHFVPCRQKMDWKKFVHKLWFTGKVKKGD